MAPTGLSGILVLEITPASSGVSKSFLGVSYVTLCARSQHQVISIAEHDFGAGAAHTIGCQSFHRPLRTHRHESRRLNTAMRRDDFAAPRTAVDCDKPEGKELGHRLAG